MNGVQEVGIEDKNILQQIAGLEEEIFEDSWSLKEIESTVKNPHSLCRCICTEGEVTAYFLCYCVLDECEIARIAVKEEYRRNGLGQKLFVDMEEECKEMGISKILLDVRSGNVPAIQFYEKNGFTVDGVRRNYYGGEYPEDAILMSRPVC